MRLFQMLIETLKAWRKTSIYHNAEFLYSLNRKILNTHYEAPKNSMQHKIIVSFTTHKTRIEYVHFVLDSLYFQTLRPAEVRLYVAQGEYERYPEILQRFQPWLQIIPTEDIKSYKKFIPALKTAKEEELIVSLDDDYVFPSDLIEKLYMYYLKYPKSLIGYCGFKNGKNYFNGIAGGMGILWNPRVFNPLRMPFSLILNYF